MDCGRHYMFDGHLVASSFPRAPNFNVEVVFSLLQTWPFHGNNFASAGTISQVG